MIPGDDRDSGVAHGCRRLRKMTAIGVLVAVSAGLVLAAATWVFLEPVPELSAIDTGPVKAQLLDRSGHPLTLTYQNRWNRHDTILLHHLPHFLQQAFIISEDKRFFEHGGVDWWARLHAAVQNLQALESVRGASTISEQVVRMLHPRSRTLWSQWLEGFEAQRLEAKNNKADILEFYLNQVPYSARRRGIVQAANYYFDRDPSTLTEMEMLALAVMVRSPAHLDVYKNPIIVARRARRLAARMLQSGAIDPSAYERLTKQELRGRFGFRPVEARHFARYVYDRISGDPVRVHTTLDAVVQETAQRILDQRLSYLHDRHIDNAALLVVDHHTNEILAWVIGRAGSEDQSAVAYDAVLTPRQPGSTLKPFVYALALSRGWTAATLIDDSPLSESVGLGLHTYRNYSRRHYGRISLRETLGNSLNIPAVKAMQRVGSQDLLNTFHELGIRSLDRHPDYYGDGLALGNGEMTLYELVQAYATLARGGVFAPLRAVRAEPVRERRRRVFDEPVAAIIGDILSDPDARRLEFGSGDLLNLPVQTAVKTGTSNDFKDAWAVGYNHRYAVGVWMGNLRGQPMREITGSTGPALVLRAVFAELNHGQPDAPLPMRPLVEKHPVCIHSGHLAENDCSLRDEWFVAGMLPNRAAEDIPDGRLRIRLPHPGLQMAMDPRIPDEKEAFEFQLNRREGVVQVHWVLNGRRLASTDGPTHNWTLQRGRHVLTAQVRLSDSSRWVQTRPVRFTVK